MILINKGGEPIAWRKKKQTPGFVKYEPIPELRDALLEEQGYICAYCTRRIPTKDIDIDATSKIEHVKSQEDSPDLQLEYSNMAICCPGNLNNEAHCDKLKGRRSVSFDLGGRMLEQSISYSAKDGEIKSENPVWDWEINNLLNLNHSLLKINRRYVIEGLISALNRKKWTSREIERQIDLWTASDNEGQKRAFCGIVIWYLNRKLRQIQ